MPSFTVIILSAFAMQAHANEQVQNSAIDLWTPAVAFNPPTLPVAPAHAETRFVTLPQTKQLVSSPSLQFDVATGYPKSGPVKGVVRLPSQARGLESKASLKEGRVPGADSYNVGEEEGGNTYGRFGVDDKLKREVEDREGYTGGITYGFKRAATPRKAPSLEETFEASPSDITSHLAVGMMGFIVGAGVTFAVHCFRLRSSAAPSEEPLLPASA